MVRKRPETVLDIERFVVEVRSYKDRTGKAHKVIAGEFGIELGYLHKILYKDKPLTLQVVEKAAPVLGLTIHDFILSEPADTASAPSRDEPFGNIMGILGKNIPEDVKKNLISIAQSYQPKKVLLDAPVLPEVAADNVVVALFHELGPEAQASMLAFGKSLRDHNHHQAKKMANPVARGKSKKTG